MRHRLVVLIATLGAFGCAGASAPPAPPAPAASPAPADTGSAAERQRPRPYPVVLPPYFQYAIRQGTRTASGAPGPNYWEQAADYTIETRVDPSAKRLEGSEDVAYHNNSPDTLPALFVNLLQNFHAPGTQRGEAAEITGGMKLTRVSVGGQDLKAVDTGIGYTVEGTVMRIVPPSPVPPGTSVRLSFEWSFKLPQAGISGRMGYDGDDLLFLAYFFPQMAVYDDAVGWEADPFMGTAEFYADFGNYDLTVEAPEGWIVNATGTLANPQEVLQPRVLQRLRAAERSDTVVHVVTADDFGHATQQEPGGELAWHFVADSVHDVAFSVTRASNWDAMRTAVGDRDGDGAPDYARVDAVWRPSASAWSHAVEYAQKSIAQHSQYTGLSYPWPHMTAVEAGAIIGGGMEYPMMTLIGDYDGAPASSLFGVIAHELAHMWIPMTVSSDERRHAWMDEGTTEYNEDVAKDRYYPNVKAFQDEMDGYRRVALTGTEEPIMRWSDYHYNSYSYTMATYNKPALLLHALHGILGDSTFARSYHAFFDRWAWKHPYPWDFFNTFNDVSGRNLDWFWRTWYYESTFDGLWLLDQAVASVTAEGDQTRITVQDNGWAPMPVLIRVTYAGGDTAHVEIPVDRWLQGATRASVTVPTKSGVTKVEIDPDEWFPDVIRRNNVWTGGA